MIFDKQKKKNILDLEYDKLLNYMNIVLISLATLIISLWITLPKIVKDFKTNLTLLIDLTLFVIIVAIIVIIIFSDKLRKKKKAIESL